jgi:hypothetical protein
VRRALPELLALALLAPLTVLTACKKDGPAGTAASASSAPAAPLAPKTVKLDVRPARIGEKSKSTRKTTLSLSVEFWSGNDKMGANETARLDEYDRTVEVLGLVGSAPAKVKAHYDSYHHKETRPGAQDVDTSILGGKTYLLDATDSLTVKTEAGKDVGAEENDALKQLHADLGEEDSIVAALGTPPIPIQKTVNLRKALFEALIGSSKGELKSGTITCTGIEKEGGRDAAAFEWSADMKAEEQNGLEIMWHLKGKALVGISPAKTLRTTAEAALDVSGKTQQNGTRVDLQGAGNFHDEHVITDL